MKIVVFGNLILCNDRGIFRHTNRLFSTVKHLYPEVEFYLINTDEGKINVNFDFVKILNSPSDVLQNGIDFIVFFGNGAGCEDNTYTKLPNVQIITMIHDVMEFTFDDDSVDLSKTPTSKNIFMKEFYQKRVNNSSTIITVSEYSKNDILKHLDVPSSTPVEVVYSAPFLKKNPKYNRIIKEPYFLYNGGYCPRKGILQLLYNFIDLKLNNKLKSKLVLTGINYLEKHTLINGLIKYGVQKGYIIDKGYVTDEELADLYINAVGMLYPSTYEGFGGPLVEAMNLGCPIITCKNSSIFEVCGDKTAYYINKHDGADFQKALMLFESKEFNNEKAKLIKNGYENVKRFTWEKNAHKFFKILKESENNNYVNKLNKLHTLMKETNQVVEEIKSMEYKFNERAG